MEKEGTLLELSNYWGHLLKAEETVFHPAVVIMELKLQENIKLYSLEKFNLCKDHELKSRKPYTFWITNTNSLFYIFLDLFT